MSRKIKQVYKRQRDYKRNKDNRFIKNFIDTQTSDM